MVDTTELRGILRVVRAPGAQPGGRTLEDVLRQAWVSDEGVTDPVLSVTARFTCRTHARTTRLQGALLVLWRGCRTA